MRNTTSLGILNLVRDPFQYFATVLAEPEEDTSLQQRTGGAKWEPPSIAAPTSGTVSSPWLSQVTSEPPAERKGGLVGLSSHTLKFEMCQ